MSEQTGAAGNPWIYDDDDSDLTSEATISKSEDNWSDDEQAAPTEQPPENRPKPPTVAEGGTPVEGSALSREELNALRHDIVIALKTVYDPEIPVDIYELGLIYKIDVQDDKSVIIDMTLTAPACPVAGEMPKWVQAAVMKVEDVTNVTVNMVFDPPWDQSLMSEEAQLALNMF